MPNATVRANAQTLPMTPEALRQALDDASFSEMIALQCAYSAAVTVFLGVENQPRIIGLIALILEDERDRLDKLLEVIGQVARGRIARTGHEAEDRGRVLLAHQLIVGPRWADIVGDGLETLCAVTRDRLTVKREA